MHFNSHNQNTLNYRLVSLSSCYNLSIWSFWLEILFIICLSNFRKVYLLFYTIAGHIWCNLSMPGNYHTLFDNVFSLTLRSYCKAYLVCSVMLTCICSMINHNIYKVFQLYKSGTVRLSSLHFLVMISISIHRIKPIQLPFLHCFPHTSHIYSHIYLHFLLLSLLFPSL